MDKLPVKAKRTAIRDRYLTYIYTRTEDGKTLLRRRGSGDIWQGLFEFPLIESERPLTMAEVEQKLSNQWPIGNGRWPITLVARDVLHQLTHQRLHADFYCLTLPASQCPVSNGRKSNVQWEKGQWVEEKSLDHYALPRLLEKLLERLKHT